MNGYYIDIIQMVSQNSMFPFIIICLTVLTANALSPKGNCLANCATCEPNNLSVCKGTQPCEWGHHDPLNSGSCSLLPTLTTVVSQLNGKILSPASSWGAQARYSTCEYVYEGRKKIIDVMGVFGRGVITLTKTFKVTPKQQVYMLSFNLLRNEWMPFNDFLMLEVSNGDKTLHSVEISYEERVKVESQTSTLNCSGKRFMSEKYNIPINGNVDSELSIVFTSSLFNSNWAITNLKLVQGCKGFSSYDEKSQTCSKCDSDSYLFHNNRGDIWCQKCPGLCSSCYSKHQCNSCIDGAKLQDGLCSYNTEYKIQRIQISNGHTVCGTQSFLMGHLGKIVTVPAISNNNNKLYDQIQVGFTIYFNPIHWNEKTIEKIRVNINKGEVMTIGYQNLTNFATDYCKQFLGQRIAVISLVSKSMIQMSSVLNIEFQLVGKNNITFGVESVFVKSLSKPLQYQTENKSKPASNETQKKIELTTSLNNVLSTLTSETTSILKPTILLLSNSSVPIQKAADQNTAAKQVQIEQQYIINSQPLSASYNSDSLNYIPAVCKSNSGLQITVQKSSPIKGQLTIKIDKIAGNNYEIATSFMDDSTLQICLNIRESFIHGIVTIYDSPVLATSRLLQQSGSVIIAQGIVPRYDYLSSSQLGSISSFSVFFSVFAWAGVILIICAVMLGYGVTMQQFIFSLQFLFLHVYIASQSLPLSFREVIAGLRVVENLNFFVPNQANQIEHQWLGNVIQRGPERLSLYNTDINFSRQFYPILIINIIYSLWFCIVLIARKWLIRQREKSLFGRVTDNIINRIVNFSDQVWRYQFLATVWFCVLQFHNLAYPHRSNRSEQINAIFCICCFITTLAWPILIGFYCRKHYYQNLYEQFTYAFQDLFYLRIPLFNLPTVHHRVGYRAFTAVKSLLIVILIACGGHTPVILLPLIALQVLELVYATKYDIFDQQKYSYFKKIENCLFICLEVLMLVLFTSEESANSQSFMALGWILSTIGAVIILNASFRAGYLFMQKYIKLMGVTCEEAEPDHNKLKTERVV